LLIYADDVKCSHGATAGHIDADTLFYLRSRGLDLDTASRMLVQAFASEIIDKVGPEPLREYLDVLFGAAIPNKSLPVARAT
jgi:Fe-S cluster assembly protein SufD